MTARSDQLNVRLSSADRDWIKTRAAAEERSVSGQIRWWIQQDREQTQAKDVTVKETQ